MATPGQPFSDDRDQVYRMGLRWPSERSLRKTLYSIPAGSQGGLGRQRSLSEPSLRETRTRARVYNTMAHSRVRCWLRLPALSRAIEAGRCHRKLVSSAYGVISHLTKRSHAAKLNCPSRRVVCWKLSALHARAHQKKGELFRSPVTSGRL